MDYNVWSGTDYLKNTMGFLPTDATVSSDYTFSTIGERSLKITTTGTKYQEVNLKNIQGNASETFVATIDVLNNTGETVELRLFEIGGGHNTVNISSNESVQTVSITRTLGTDCTLRAILILRYPLTVYIDNVRLDKR
ncbi:hypothetical protein [Methanobrevibacter sp.]|jgi:hypothetical protein|uniref:hypothetical protein n=1 Tax=Methanobrevibacter sp. TaxID=66852 RepID=UPI0038693DC3